MDSVVDAALNGWRARMHDVSQFAIFRDVDFKDSAAKINAREIFKAVCGKDAPTEVRFL